LRLLEHVKLTGRTLRQDVVALYFAAKDPRTPWYAKAIVICIIAYALTPIDLIPDFIPVLGYIDDLLFLPLGIYIAIKIIPEPVLVDCRKRLTGMEGSLPRNWTAAATIVLLWIGAASALAMYLWRIVR
jgi:uncharacterized membrane protein YkvA (DUF1232 family)